MLTTLLVAAALGACGSATGTGAPASSTPSSASSPSSTPSATPSGPATADLTFTGDAALAVPLTKVTIECLVPRFDGTYITLSGMPQGEPPNGLSVVLVIRDGNIAASVATGSGQNLAARNFTGTGTSGFDAGKGVHLSGALTENTPATTNRGTIGVITSVTGSVNCGNQTMGTSTIKVTGVTKEGPVDVTLTPARVLCLSGSSGYLVSITGITTLNGAPGLVIVTLGQTSLQAALQRQGGPNHFYIAQGQVGTTVSASGGHVDGDAAEQAATGTPGTVHVTGDATCGSSGTY